MQIASILQNIGSFLIEQLVCSPNLLAKQGLFKSLYRQSLEYPDILSSVLTTHRSRRHYSRPLPLRYRYEIESLQNRFNSEDAGDKQNSCHIAEYTGARRKTCGIDHFQGKGKLVKASCSVKFIRIIPYNLAIYPYIIWVSIGARTHPPPAINKTPRDIRQGLLNIIQQINDPSLTRTL